MKIIYVILMGLFCSLLFSAENQLYNENPLYISPYQFSVFLTSPLLEKVVTSLITTDSPLSSSTPAPINICQESALMITDKEADFWFSDKEDDLWFKVSTPEVNNPPTKSKIRTHQCQSCGKCFAARATLKNHAITHTGEKPYKCNNCGKLFSRKGHLKTHVRIHTGEKPFQCVTCGHSFPEKKNLSRHVRAHTGEKPFHCNDCGKSFARKDHLIEHNKTHKVNVN